MLDDLRIIKEWLSQKDHWDCNCPLGGHKEEVSRLFLQCLQGVEVTQTAEGKDVSTWYEGKNPGRFKQSFWITKEGERFTKRWKIPGRSLPAFPLSDWRKMPKWGARKSLNVEKRVVLKRQQKLGMCEIGTNWSYLATFCGKAKHLSLYFRAWKSCWGTSATIMSMFVSVLCSPPFRVSRR